jgi:hypothetical protein
MEAVFIDQSKFSLRGTCPHTPHESVFVMVTSPYLEVISSHPAAEYRVVVAMQCQGCMEYVLGIARHRQGTMTYQYENHYPLGKPDDAVDEEIPEHIQPDFREALRCLWVNAYNATAEMCRRAIEASCIDFGAPKRAVLEDMIDWLADQRIITPFLQKVAHKIRLGGNRGAHPPADGPAAQPVLLSPDAASDSSPAPITKIEKEHADAIVKFTREFFHHVYVVPKQLDKYDFSRSGSSKTA